MLRTRHRSRPYLLSMTSSPSALVAVPGFSSFHFRFAPSDKSAFCHSSLVTLYPAPLSPLDDNGSIAWSVRVPVQYIRPNTWPGKLQSSLLGYFPGLYETVTGDTDAPSRHSCAARSLLKLSSLSPHPASAPVVSSIASCIRVWQSFPASTMHQYGPLIIHQQSYG